uniref:Uncharacterized protein n=1 Tax=Hyaloperonospora arabidopsidis (strain Emoy2) TaxID=559515 RepID=M4BF31_HYAAE
MSRDASPRATAAGWVAEAADELSSAASGDPVSPAAVERSLTAAFSAALVAHRMELLTMRRG